MIQRLEQASANALAPMQLKYQTEPPRILRRLLRLRMEPR
jgi:hypothetical protein